MTSTIETEDVVELVRVLRVRSWKTRLLVDQKHFERAADTIERLREENARLRRCLLPVHMMLAQAECVDEPLPDNAVVMHFMGSGASDQVTAGEVRAALNQQ